MLAHPQSSAVELKKVLAWNAYKALVEKGQHTGTCAAFSAYLEASAALDAVEPQEIAAALEALPAQGEGSDPAALSARTHTDERGNTMSWGSIVMAFCWGEIANWGIMSETQYRSISHWLDHQASEPEKALAAYPGWADPSALLETSTDYATSAEAMQIAQAALSIISQTLACGQPVAPHILMAAGHHMRESLRQICCMAAARERLEVKDYLEQGYSYQELPPIVSGQQYILDLAQQQGGNA